MGNNKWSGLGIFLAICLVYQLAFPWRSELAHAGAKATFDPALENKMFSFLNEDRVQRGLAALRWDDHLQRSARKHTERLAQTGQLTHKFPDEPILMERVAETGLHFSTAAENLVYSTDPDELHSALMSSPGHRANILSPKYNSVGIGVMRVGERFFATQNFAHVTEESKAAESENRFAAAFNQLRQERKMPPIPVESDARIRAAMCDMADHDNLSAASVPKASITNAAVAFTAIEPEQLPSQISKVVALPNVKRVFVGACFRATPKYPGGVYWFGVTY